MRDGFLKCFLYKTKIMPVVSHCLDKTYNYIKRIKEKPDRWYFRFLPINKRKIVFDSYFGKGYCDNPKAIADEIIRQNLEYKLVWLTNNYCNMPPKICQVKYGSPEAMRELATAKMWIFNARGVIHPKKRNKQVYLHTWHAGYVVKLIEKEAEDRLNDSYLSVAKLDGSITDAVVSSSSFFTSIYKNSFWLRENTEILEIGTPKNDVIFDRKKKQMLERSIRARYSIDANKKIVLYFPTFRDDGKLDHYSLNYSKIVETLNKKNGGEYIVLVRLHPNLAKYALSRSFIEQLGNDAINVSDYPEACELFGMAESLISDYSGVLIAFALQKKPIYIYAPDLDEYIKERGLNRLYDIIPCKKCVSNEELIDEIRNFDEVSYQKQLNEFFDIIQPFDYGDASAKTVDWIKKKLGLV